MKTFKSFLIIFAWISIFNHVNAQQIENLQIKTFEDKVNVVYNLTHEKAGQLFDVKLLCSNNGGQSFDVPVKAVSGDCGKDIEGGNNKIIIWDVLEDQKTLQGDNYVFKVVATPGKTINPSDHVEKFEFELAECYKKDRKLICILKIKNNGKRRDLKMINRLARVYDFNGKRLESNYSKLGRVTGNARYATPTLTFQPGQSDVAMFSFDMPYDFSDRIKMIEFGVEVLEITYGLDLKIGNIQFRDISYSNNEQVARTENSSGLISLNIGAETTKKTDTTPPQITFTDPVLTKEKPINVKSEEIVLKGKVSDENSIYELTVNGMYTNLKENGEFDTDIYLAEGGNTVFVRAVDNFDNTIEETYTINYTPENKQGQRQSNMADHSAMEKKSSKEGKYYALFIGVSEYSDPEIMNLEQPVVDAEKLLKTITQYYTFDNENVTFLKSPTREEIISHLDHLNKVVTEDDNLLVFYAGHGYWDNEDEAGYWLPSDAKKTNTANWMRNSTIRDYLRTVNTKHTLLIADACFSGGIFKSRKAFNYAPKPIQELYVYPSRKAMTSGSLKEVPDKSVFLLYLNKRLQENTRPYISAEELFSSFKNAVLNNSPNTPLYGEIKDTGDEGGDFIFVKRN
ncbi:MAG: caspase family protein [Bacteroidetes bacterium]|nr:caspase family protein [Bacteroidota bacterium]